MRLSTSKEAIKKYFDSVADKRTKWILRNINYYKDLSSFFKFNIPEGSSILEVGCGTGSLLNSLKPSKGVGIDISGKMIEIAKQNNNDLEFHQMDVETLELNETFDYIILSDMIGYLEDVQEAFEQLQKASHKGTRIIINYQNFLWLPLLNLAELLRLKMPSKRINWLNTEDISNLLELTNFDVVKTGRRFLFPINIPIISKFINKFIGNLPIFNAFCITNYVIARPLDLEPMDNKNYSVSVLIPTRNEKGNVENAIKRLPRMGKHTEVIFVEGGSSDGTYEEIIRVAKKYEDSWDIKYCKQEGKGKGDAVRKGFSIATGDILMILDADLTVPPKDLTKFYNAIATGKGEYINGTRLVYPMEDEAMRTLNILGNKFFSLAFSWLLSQRMKDTLCGTKVISRENWYKLVANRDYFGDFDPFGDFDLIFGASKMNLKTVEVPIRYQSREYGSTQISRFRHGWLLIRMFFFATGKLKFV